METMSPVALLNDELVERTGRRLTGGVRTIADHLPLIHRTSYPERLLQGDELEPGQGGPCRTDLGLDGHTYFWVGASAYDQWNVTLIWEAYVEGTMPASVAAPWDTGGLCSQSLGQGVPPDRARELLVQYSLPAPDYREFLAGTIECCFDDIAGYLSCVSPEWYPGWIIPRAIDPSPPHHTFELRRAGPVTIEHGLVAIVAVESWFVDNPRMLRALKQWARRKEADWVAVEESREQPTQAVQRFVRNFLAQRDLIA